MSLDAMKQALEALEGFIPYLPLPDKTQCGRYDKAITALRAAIEQAQDTHDDWCASLTQLLMSMPPKPAPCNCKLKTAQRDSRQWQGLTKDELLELWELNTEQPFPEWFVDFKRAYEVIEAKLKEKNG